MKVEDPKNVDLQADAKKIVLDHFDKSGLMNKMKAQIKFNVLQILEKQKQNIKQKVEFDYSTPLHRMNKTKEIVLACHLIKEFLQFYEMDYTFPIFENESNIRENIKKETLTTELSLQNNLNSSVNEPKPLLVQLIASYQAELKNKINQEQVANRLDESYGVKSNLVIYANNLDAQSVKSENNNPIMSPGLGHGKKQLSPINFINKSVEMKDPNTSQDSSKFNTANIDEFYSKEKQDTNINKSNNSNNSNSNLTDYKNYPLNTLNTDENKKIIKENNQNKEANNISPYQYQTNEYNTNDKYDEEFNEVILEEIEDPKIRKEENENEDSKKSITGSANNFMSSLGYDSSITNYKLEDFDHVEEVEKPL
jgi:hypothetical protein